MKLYKEDFNDHKDIANRAYADLQSAPFRCENCDPDNIASSRIFIKRKWNKRFNFTKNKSSAYGLAYN